MESAVIGVLELASIAVGIRVLDSMVKAAPVKILEARSVCPGKYLAVITGSVAEVEISLARGKEAGQGCLVDELFISNLDPQIIPAIKGRRELPHWNALGILESFSAAASIEAGDAAAKEAEVWIAEIRLATGLGGKSTLKMIGPIEAVEAAMAAAGARIRAKGLLCQEVIIPNPHPDIRPFLRECGREDTLLWK
jgi:microcompartment protein CcmL/EutN